MLRKLFYILLFFTLVFYVKSQSVYFSKRYDNFNACDGAIGIDTFNLKYFTFGITCTPITFYALNLNLYDYSTGNLNKSKTYQWVGNNFIPNEGKGIRLNKENYVISGSRYYKTDTSLVFQWKFNKNLDSVLYKEYGFLNQVNVINAMTLGKDNCIYMTGFVNNSNYTNADILLIKTDTSGNEIWKKKIGLSTWSEEGFSISSCSNGDLLIGGVKYVPNYTSANQGPTITRVDTSGSVKWQNFYPSLAYAGGSWCNKELSNGEIVFTGTTARVVGSSHLRRLTFTKVDALGNLVWGKTFGPESVGNESYPFIQDEMGNYILSAQISYTTNNNTVSGLVYKLDSNGDSITSREYKIGALSQNYFRDLVRAPDRGYVFAGWVSPIPANGDTGTQDIWLLKTDSLLCEYQSCPISLLAVHELSNDFDKNFLIYPNPVVSKITISYNGTLDSPLAIKLFDIQGKELLSEISRSNNFILNLDLFNPAIYFLEIKNNLGRTIRKINKQ